MSLKDKLKCLKIVKKSLTIVSPRCNNYYLEYSFMLFSWTQFFLNTMVIIMSMQHDSLLFSLHIRLLILWNQSFNSFIIIILTVVSYYWVSELIIYAIILWSKNLPEHLLLLRTVFICTYLNRWSLEPVINFFATYTYTHEIKAILYFVKQNYKTNKWKILIKHDRHRCVSLTVVQC